MDFENNQDTAEKKDKDENKMECKSESTPMNNEPATKQDPGTCFKYISLNHLK